MCTPSEACAGANINPAQLGACNTASHQETFYALGLGHLANFGCDAGGEFSLFYTNCEKLTVVSFDIKVALYNVRANGYKDFLSVGEDMLPIVFMVSQHIHLS